MVSEQRIKLESCKPDQGRCHGAHLNSDLGKQGATEASRQRSSSIKLLLLMDYSGSWKPPFTTASYYSASSDLEFSQLNSQHQSCVEALSVAT